MKASAFSYARATSVGNAIELLVAAQAIDLRRPLRPAAKVAEAHARLRAAVPHLDEDRELHRDVEAVCRLVDEGTLAV